MEPIKVEKIVFDYMSLPDPERRMAVLRMLEKGNIVIGKKLELIPKKRPGKK